MVVSAAVHALLSALFQLFLREILSTLSMLTHASTAVLAQLSVLFQLFLRAEPSSNNKENSRPIYRVDCFFIIAIWRSQMNEETLAFPSAWLSPALHSILFFVPKPTGLPSRLFFYFCYLAKSICLSRG